MREVYNEAWHDNWGFVPFTSEELEVIATEYKNFLDPEIALVAEVDGKKLAGFRLAAVKSDHYDMTMVVKGSQPNQVAAAEFKAKCLQVMDQVAKSKRPMIVTKRGKPMVRIVPIDEPVEDDIFGCLADKFEIVGDIEEPSLPARLWSRLT